ncbi:MAG: DsbE family thiol:disulfide interchange protein [Gammaproteobacteria bacterium]|nr:DsbE family thiol:disulfide interchange protein [Gammaproteobacteria bacterium]
MSVKSLIIPLGVFLGLVGILAIGFTLEDPHYLPSELINRPFPEFSAAELHDESRQVTTEDLQGQVSLVNVWATWCANCIIEHPELMRIKNEEDIPIYGINYNDDVAKARRWLERYDNPYELNIVDDEGKLGIDLGVYGAPETFIIDENAVIQYRHVGVLTEEIFDDTFRPIIDQLERDDSEGRS